MRRLLEEHLALPCSPLTNQDEDTSEPITIFLNRFDRRIIPECFREWR